MAARKRAAKKHAPKKTKKKTVKLPKSKSAKTVKRSLPKTKSPKPKSKASKGKPTRRKVPSEAHRKGWDTRRAREAEKRVKRHEYLFEHDPKYRKDVNWGVAAGVNLKLGVAQITRDGRQWKIGEEYDHAAKVRLEVLQGLRATGDGAIDLLEMLCVAEDQGRFHEGAMIAAEEFGMEIKDVYDLWMSPQHHVPEGF